jgi:prophage DNA circulation protein
MSADTFFRNVQGISNTTQGIVDVLGRLTSGSFRQQLRPASYRGVRFGVLNGHARFGRRNAVHEYPFRDTVWVEDLGRASRRITVSGFLVGDDVIAQRDRLIAACEKSGDGELTHPTLGRRTVSLLDFSTEERWDEGRVFEVTFVFVEQGKRLYPDTAAGTSDLVTTAADAADEASAATFAKRAVAALKDGAAAVNQAAQTAAAWSEAAVQSAHDATSLLKLAVSLPGEFGRLLGQLSGITAGQVVAVAVGMTVQGLAGQAAVSRQSVASKAASMESAGSNLTTGSVDTFSAQAQELSASVLAAAPTPGDALRGLSALLVVPTQSGLAGAALLMQTAASDVLRRSAVIAMARAGAAYQPISSDDAVAVRGQVLAAIDGEITVAGDQGDDDVYTALRALRANVVGDLNTRGASLPTLVTVRTAATVPALALAQRLYRDPSRTDEIVGRAGPVHPAFMPLTFKTLNA